MQELLSQLSTEIAIVLIVAIVVTLVLVVLIARRRRRQAPPEEAGAPSLGGPIDYTSLPLDEEPQGWRDRFNNLPLAGKILAVLVPILVILGLIVLVLALMPNEPSGPPPPTPVPVTLTLDGEPTVIRAEPLTVDVGVRTTGLGDGTELTVEMFEDGEPFPWLDPEFARGTVRRNRAEIQVVRAANAPTPQQGREYTVVVRAPGGQTTPPAPLVVPEINNISAAFFGGGAPTPVPEPTAEPTSTPEPTAVAAATPEPSPTAVALPTGPAAGVANGGNVRALPFVTAENRVGGVNAGDSVQLIARTPNGAWYQVRFTNVDNGSELLGWISASLLSVDATTAAQVPVAPIVSVFRTGALYEQPDLNSTQIDRVNAAAQIPDSEVVELKRKTADGAWYEVTNVRGLTGWVPAELLGIPDDVAARVPVAE